MSWANGVLYVKEMGLAFPTVTNSHPEGTALCGYHATIHHMEGCSHVIAHGDTMEEMLHLLCSRLQMTGEAPTLLVIVGVPAASAPDFTAQREALDAHFRGKVS